MPHSKATLSFKQKHLICQYSAQNPQVQQKELGDWAKKKFSLSYRPCQGTISRILKRKEVYLTNLQANIHPKKNLRKSKNEALDQQLAEWVKQCAHRGIFLTDDLIKNKGKLIADSFNITDLAFSNGWLYCFKRRHGFRLRKLNSRQGKVDNMLTETEIPQVSQAINRYSLPNIYCMDETSLCYQIAPGKTQSEHCFSKKETNNKTRLTIAFTVNADGTDKLPPLIIGTAHKHRLFRNKSNQDVHFDYKANKKAIMTTNIFNEWLLKLDHCFQNQNRRILLIVDNAPSHRFDITLLSNIELLILPLDTPSRCQPLDCGILTSFKKHYRCLQVANALGRDDAGQVDIYKIDQLSAMHWITSAWNEINQDVIIDSFRDSSLFPAASVDIGQKLQSSRDVNDQELNGLIPNIGLREPSDVYSLLQPSAFHDSHSSMMKGELARNGLLHQYSIIKKL